MLVARAVGEVAKRGFHRDPRLFDMDPEAMMAYADFDPTLPWWGGPLLWIIYFGFMYMIFSVHYSIDHVMGTAAMVESTSPVPAYTSVPRLDREEKEKAGDDPDDPLLFPHHESTTPYVPLTRHIRTFRRHIRSIGGRTAKFRALHYCIVWMVPFGCLHAVLDDILRFPMGNFIAAALAGAISAPLHAAWTHAILAMPDQSSFRARHAHARRGWRAIALPAAIWGASAEFIVSLARLCFRTVADMTGHGTSTVYSQQKLSISLVCTGVFLLVYGFFIDARLRAVLVRVEAAMFPVDEETIVPLDAELSDLVRSTDNGKYRMNCAVWKSFVRPFANGGYQRYLLLFFKMMAITWALLGAMFGSLFLALWACWGNQLIMLIRALKASYVLYLEDVAKAIAAQQAAEAAGEIAAE